jgi:CHAT domain-containing protein
MVTLLSLSGEGDSALPWNSNVIRLRRTTDAVGVCLQSRGLGGLSGLLICVVAVVLLASTATAALGAGPVDLQSLLDTGQLSEAEAAAAQVLAEVHPANRADSLRVLEAARVLVEARQRLSRYDDPSMPGLVEFLMSMSLALHKPGTIAVAYAHQYAGFQARAGGEYEEEIKHFQAALDIIAAAEPPDPWELAIALSNLAVSHLREGDCQIARELLERGLKVLEECLPPDHIAFGATLLNLNDARVALDDTVGVAENYARAVRVFEMHEGPDGSQVADALYRQGLFQLGTGNARSAGETLGRAIDILEIRDAAGSRLAASLLAGARARLELATPDSAAALVARASDIYLALYGEADPAVAACLVTAGDAARQMFRHDEARDYYLGALAILDDPSAGDPESLEDCLQALASHSLELGRNSDALTYSRRALEVSTRIRGPHHRKTATDRLAYGAALRSTQEPDSAIAQYRLALADLEAVADSGDRVLAEPYLRLGAIARERGDLPDARTNVERALGLLRRRPVTDDPMLAQCLHELGILQRMLGDVPGAYTSLTEALQLASGPGRDTAAVAAVLGSLAILDRALGNQTAAMERFREALEILDRVLPGDNPQRALVVRNLASLENEGGQFAQAEAHYRQALTILEQALGPDHPDVAATHLGLGNALRELGRVEEAREHYSAAIEIHRRALGPDAPALALDLHNLAALQLDSGETEAATENAREAERLSQQHFRLVAQGVSEREALHYSAGRVSGTDIVLTAAARSASDADWERAWDLVIESRAVVLEEIANRRRFLSSAQDPHIADLIADLTAASNELAYLAIRGRGVETRERYEVRLADARRAKEAAERNLATENRQFGARQALQTVRGPQVREALPPRSALIAWVRFDRLEYTVHDGETDREQRAPGRPYYAAFVVSAAEAPIRLVSLGDAKQIEALVAEWHEQAGSGPRTRGIAAAEKAYLEAGTALRRAVWDPVAAGLDSVDRIFLVPDGALALVNFDALPCDSGGFLLEHAPLLQILSSERDLCGEGSRPSRGAGLLTVAAPDYDLLPGAQGGAAEAKAGATRGVACGQFKSLWFDPLPGTGVEQQAVVQLWSGLGAAGGRSPRTRGQVHRLVGAGATEREFKGLASGCEVLHIATHGFFLGAECAGRATKGGAAAPDELTFAGLVAESPLLLSGLAFAGANSREKAPSSDDDGVLTAEEVTTLDLDGVDMVLLSACETGLGKIEAGEGVFGLRRAFQIAGARSVVMTLWSVDDEAAAAWMTKMFEYQLRGDLSVAQSVRAASLAVLSERRSRGLTTHPCYWGAYVAAGEWK